MRKLSTGIFLSPLIQVILSLLHRASLPNLSHFLEKLSHMRTDSLWVTNENKDVRGLSL